ncbi:hypothetical protein QQF64_024747 [Cirrhinus molitorella]|uniref:Uncharacterized protein n=1 Tax=Cirrhinus molitorella TaxID=172907 RepID=A0ABR3NME6_9TELE
MLRANPGPVSEWMTADKLKSEPGGQQQSGGKGAISSHNAVRKEFSPIVPLEHLLSDSQEHGAAEACWRRITSALGTQRAAHTDADGYWQPLATERGAVVQPPAGGGV